MNRKILTLLGIGGTSLFSSIIFGLVSSKLHCNEWPCAGSCLFFLFALLSFASLIFTIISFGNALLRYLENR